ncbi:hypothetical protein V4F55_003488 [Vibrio parahaemolyticus]|nr:hypothetical protein [Vibrio parahaemolyticus]EIV8506198.1 hypothetical protein [Vibrio parahaemolyticus]EJF4459376.1 hypothetical protein [Vibrio parahaemolyticus]ELA9875822.1 hypothetical protein [Vibrio parahaemolyticus]
MFGFGKKKRIDSLVETIGSSVTGQTMLMPISADQLIIDAKSDPLIAGYFLGYQLHLIQNSPFPEKDHQGILLDSYYNLFGPDGDEIKIFAYEMSRKQNQTFNSGIETAINDLILWQNDSNQAPLSLVRILNDKYQ